MKILLGVPGGIAAYKAIEFTRLAIKAGHSVRVIQTPASLRFVGRASFAAITGAPVLASEFEADPSNGSWPGEASGVHTPISHLALVEGADVMVIAPATANTLARLASGSAEDLVTTSALAATCPVVLAPAMNNLMWDNPATASNLVELKTRGFKVLEPTEGSLASHGEEGKGRLVEPDEILRFVDSLEARSPGAVHDDKPLRVLISAGGTREAIDDVRFIGNRSSGKMGVELANAAVRAGCEVKLVGANLAVEPDAGVEVARVVTASEMESELSSSFPDFDVLVMAAAVADFVPSKAEEGKIDKSQGVPDIQLEPAPDILSGLSAARSGTQTIVGFAAEHGSQLERARQKLDKKGLDLIVFNDISDSSIGFDSDENEVVLIAADRIIELPRGPKSSVAEQIMARIFELRSL